MKRKITSEFEKWALENRQECLLVRGPRQVGKTYSILDFIRKRFDSILIIDFFQNPEYGELFEGSLSSDDILRKARILIPGFVLVPGNTVLFLDEIQFCPNARAALKYLAQDSRIKVIASGSLLGLNYREVISYPVGYERSITMCPMDFEEFLWALGLDEDIIDRIKGTVGSREPFENAVLHAMDDYYRTYLVVGGMPEAVHEFIGSKDYPMVRKIQEKILEGYCNDIGKYSEPNQRDKIFALLDSIPYQISQTNKKFMYSRIGAGGNANADVYSKGIQWLIDSGIVIKCCNVTNPKLPLESYVNPSQFKLYFCDTGLLLAMLPETVVHAVLSGDVRTNQGAILENSVACSLFSKHFPVRYFGTKTFEIDFVVPMRGDVAAIEVKSGNNRRSKSLNSMKEKYGTRTRMKFEVTNVEVTGDGVEHYPLFCSQFIESMFVPYKIDLSVPDPEKVAESVRKTKP